MTSCAASVFAGLAIAVSVHTVAGKCPEQWLASVGTGAELGGYVLALAVYDDELIAGGHFTSAGSMFVNHIARWNGSTWQALGTGTSGEPGQGDVYALTVYNDEFIAGGDFSTAGGIMAFGVARWNGSAWQALGMGINGTVKALTVHNGELIAGGSFSSTGSGVPANHIARWNGSTWDALGDGVGGFGDEVDALTVYNDELIAGGTFLNHIARWNGSTWETLGMGVNQRVWALSVHNGELIAGGEFTSAGGASASRIARWNGSTWQTLGTGMSTAVPPPAVVYALTGYKDDLVAGGIFTTAGGVPAQRIARWDGRSWEPLGQGVNSNVFALTQFNDQLIAGGLFSTAGLLPASFWARWSPACVPADLNGDGFVDGLDLALLLGNWTGPSTYGQCPPSASADLDHDCRINGFDLALLLGTWGPA